MKRLLLMTLLFTGIALGQDLLTFNLKGGSSVVGHIQAGNETHFFVLDLRGDIQTVDKASIESIKKGTVDITAQLLPAVTQVVAPRPQFRRIATMEESMASIAKSFDTLVIIQIVSIIASVILLLVAQ